MMDACLDFPADPELVTDVFLPLSDFASFFGEILATAGGSEVFFLSSFSSPEAEGVFSSSLSSVPDAISVLVTWNQEVLVIFQKSYAILKYEGAI